MPSTITDRLNGLTTSVAVKAPCRAATTANITLSGTQTIDGVAVVAGDRVLVKSQTAAIDNGIWVVGSGTWARATDFDGSLDAVGGTFINVISGTVNGNTSWRVAGSSTALVLGSDTITLEAAGLSTTSAITHTGTSATAIARSLRDVVMEMPYSVMEEIPASLHASVRDGSIATSVIAYMDTAATYAANNNRPLWFPRGTYPFLTWLPPANLIVLTDGKGTTFKQLDTAAVGTRMIDVQVDGVELWPDGAATCNGQIDTIPGNATQFNSGVRLHAPTGVTIKTFRMGDVYGRNLGGDVFETGAAGTGRIKHVEVGALYGDNIYRAICVATSGESGRVAAVIQTGGVGLGALFIEPDATSPNPGNWSFGQVRGRTASLVGDPGVRVGDVKIDHLELDYDAFGVSNPAFNTGGVSLATAPDQFLHGLRMRNLRSLDIAQMTVKGHPRCAIFDLGENAGDDYMDSLRIGSLSIDNVQSDAAYAIGSLVLRKIRNVDIGTIEETTKATLTDPTLMLGGVTTMDIRGGRIEGRICDSATVDKLTFTGITMSELAAGSSIFRNVTGQVILRNVTGSGTAGAMFNNCSVAPVVENCTFTASPLLDGTTPNALLLRSTISSIYYHDAWAVTQAAVASAAALTLPKAGNVIPISGTTSITSIAADAGNKGRTVTLVFQAALTFTDGPNLLLAGNLVTTADDTITIATADGTAWYEVCRSVN